MAKAKRYPANFSPHSKPYWYASVPEKTIPENTEIHRIELYSGGSINEDLREGLIYRFDLDYDYGCCYYPSDERSAKCCLIGYTETNIDNPNYKTQLTRYNKDKKKHEENLKQWNEWKVFWDEDQEKERTIREKAQLEALKKKYEG